MKNLKLELPTFIILKNKKSERKYQLNFNVFHNLNRFTYNNIKKEFKQQIQKTLSESNIEPIESFYSLIYTITAPNKRTFDIANVLCIIDKLFCDALQELNITKDDNFNYLKNIEFKFDKIDTKLKNKKCIVEIVY